MGISSTYDGLPPAGMQPTFAVPMREERLFRTCLNAADRDVSSLEAALRADCVVMIEDAAPEDADRIVGDVAHHFGLLEALQKQAAFAPSMGTGRTRAAIS